MNVFLFSNQPLWELKLPSVTDGAPLELLVPDEPQPAPAPSRPGRQSPEASGESAAGRLVPVSVCAPEPAAAFEVRHPSGMPAPVPVLFAAVPALLNPGNANPWRG